jgi:hypothetical protein
VEFVAASGSNVIYEWHLDQRPPPPVTMPRIDGYEGLMIFEGCSGPGELTVKVSIPTGRGLTQTVGCNGAIGLGAGFSAFDVGHGPGPFGPTTFEISITEGVTDAEFFATSA